MRIEQAVYGTFRFTEGFTLVSASEGLGPVARRAVVQVCKSWGEVLGSGFGSALYHVPVEIEDEDETGILHLVGKVVRQGTDAGGVRTAWYQQVLAMDHRDYLEGGADCFAFREAGLFKDRWFETDRCVPMEIDPGLLQGADLGDVQDSLLQLAGRVARALADGRRVRFSAPEPTTQINRMFRVALQLLPAEFRSRVSLATFAFRPTIEYDLWCLEDRDSLWSDSAPVPLYEARDPDESLLDPEDFDSSSLHAAIDEVLDRSLKDRNEDRSR